MPIEDNEKKQEIEIGEEGKKYWDAEAGDFDRIYAEDGSLNGILNRIFRADMQGRTQFALRHAGLRTAEYHEPNAPEILEIGCGTGIHTKLLLQNGAGGITGVDFSPEMLQRARHRTRDFGDRVKFVEGDFMTVNLAPEFDIATIIGVFDYVDKPIEFLRRAAALTSKKIIASFPRAGTLRALIRRVRLSLKGCPVYFYSEEDLRKIAEACDLHIAVCEIIGQLHCVVFEPNGETGKE